MSFIPLSRFVLLVMCSVFVGACANESVVVGRSTIPSPRVQDWKTHLTRIPLPRKGCFQTNYPQLQWQSVACVAAPTYPQPPSQGPRPDTVGNADDVAAEAPSGFISTATGSFDSVTDVASESGPIGNTGPSIADTYTLQLNTNPFTSTACAGSPNPSCQGWQQFMFTNAGATASGGAAEAYMQHGAVPYNMTCPPVGGCGAIAGAYIQYWLIDYNTTCPPGEGWNQFSFTGSSDISCWKNDNLGIVPVPFQPITNLGHLSLVGSASASGDSNIVYVGSHAYTVSGDNAVNAAAGWNAAEFNVFGNGGNENGGGMASFNSGAHIAPRTQITYGGTAAPICEHEGFTAETNNLSFGPSVPAISPPGPALAFTESSAGGSPGDCAAASSIGDTHLRTFNGLFYDFQATGDFLLAQSSKFAVQTRQVSGAPTWPNAAVNQAVATQMGGSHVALCTTTKQTPLVVNGHPVALADGTVVALPDGVDVSRQGNVYQVTDQSGNSMTAVMNGTAINVSVGLGTWPTKVVGLLANTNGNVNMVATRDGTVVNTPLAFAVLYGRYGESWRVAPDDSLLTVCGGEPREQGVPTNPFFANDLPTDTFTLAQTVCTQASIQVFALLNACILDVAVMGSKDAATVYVGAPAPVAIGEAGQPGGTKP